MNVAVYGAAGHTARFVLAQLLERGHRPIAIGRDDSRLIAAANAFDRAVETRVAALDASDALERALAGTDAVIHCAGPFLDTARPLVAAALRTGTHYFDLTAEQGSALSTFTSDAPARERGVCVVPAAGFYGGLGDLLVTHAMAEWAQADRIDVAIALNRWWPTAGTRATGRRNTAPRLAFYDGTLQPMQPSEPAPWSFPEPFGTQDVVELPFTETILIARHLPVHEIRNYLNRAPLDDLRDSATTGPIAADERGRSEQRFLVEVVVRRGDTERRVAAKGRDIYSVTAPIVVEAVERVCGGRRGEAGAFALGQVVDATDVLRTLDARGEIELGETLQRESEVALAGRGVATNRSGTS